MHHHVGDEGVGELAEQSLAVGLPRLGERTGRVVRNPQHRIAGEDGKDQPRKRSGRRLLGIAQPLHAAGALQMIEDQRRRRIGRSQDPVNASQKVSAQVSMSICEKARVWNPAVPGWSSLPGSNGQIGTAARDSRVCEIGRRA